jgi:hypothetical protein
VGSQAALLLANVLEVILRNVLLLLNAASTLKSAFYAHQGFELFPSSRTTRLYIQS